MMLGTPQDRLLALFLKMDNYLGLSIQAPEQFPSGLTPALLTDLEASWDCIHTYAGPAGRPRDVREYMKKLWDRFQNEFAQGNIDCAARQLSSLAAEAQGSFQDFDDFDLPALLKILGVIVLSPALLYLSIIERFRLYEDQIPQAAEKMMYMILPKAQRDHVIGDLEEEYQQTILPKFGRSFANKWYWKQSLFSCISNIFGPVIGFFADLIKKVVAEIICKLFRG